MNLTEAAKLVAILKGVYLREQFTEESPQAFLWLLGDLPFQAVIDAAQIHGRRSKWCPTPAELRDIIAEQTVPETTPGEAWALVKKQMARYGLARYGEWEFDDPAIADAVKAAGVSHLCTSEEQYARRDFEKALTDAQERRRRGVQDGTAAPALTRSNGRSAVLAGGTVVD